MHNSWSKSVLAQWKSTKAPGRAVSAFSGLVVSCSKNKETHNITYITNNEKSSFPRDRNVMPQDSNSS